MNTAHSSNPEMFPVPAEELNQMHRRDHLTALPGGKDASNHPGTAVLHATASALDAESERARAEGALSYKWEPGEYTGTGNDGFAKPGSAWKLHDSAIAPIVVAARGYVTISEPDFADATKKYGLPRRSTTQGRRIAEALSRGQIMIMPWYTTGDLAQANVTMSEPQPSTVQFRPTKPELNDDGKEQKYEFIGGQKTPVGVHPSFTADWVAQAPIVLIAEGLLKGDSALTGYLLGEGVSPAELAWDGSKGGFAEARAHLMKILDTIPTDRRVVFLTIGGVYNWRNNAEWADMTFGADRAAGRTAREVWVGFDGDVSSNLNVWTAASELWEFLESKKKAGKVCLIAPTVKADGQEKKVGIDDYLSVYGTWKGLLGMLADTLPPRPPSNDAEFAGKHRVSADGTALQFCEPIKDPFNPEGSPAAVRWVDVYPLGGRIVETRALRTPSTAEIKTGKIGEGVNLDDAQNEAFCTVEVAWKADDDTIMTALIKGPDKILDYPPDQWDRHKAHIPTSIRTSENWPPSKKIGEDWLRAMKAHRKGEITSQVMWEAMGWVPVEGAVPAYIVGEQIIGAEDAPDGVEILAGIGETELAGASRFGVGKHIIDGGDFNDPVYCAEIKEDIEKTLDAFVLGGAWTDRRVASAIVAAALRPVMPIRPSLTLNLQGPPGKGKSMSAAMILGWWSAKPGTFDGDSLPGSASDTPAAIELAMARANVWVIDDLAPSSSRQQSDAQQDKIGIQVRNTFNGQAKRRSNVDMGARKVNLPRALCILTAENELTVASARQRCVTIHIGHGSLPVSNEPTNRVGLLCKEDGAPSRVTQALIRYMRNEAKQMTGGWAALYQETDEMRQYAVGKASDWMRKHGSGGDVTRHSGMAGDLAFSLMWLYRLAKHTGVREEVLDLLRQHAMLDDISSLLTDGHNAAKASTPGQALLEALRTALYQGDCHVIAAHDPAALPGGTMTASSLGWEIGSEGRHSAKGRTVGCLYTEAATGNEYIYFQQAAAFAVAKERFPGLIPPGSTDKTAWGSFVGEGLAVNDLLAKKASGESATYGRKKVPSTTGEKDANGNPQRNQFSGTPVLLSMLLHGPNEDDE